MSRLRIFAEDHPDEPLLVADTTDAIARELQAIGVAFEQWDATQPVQPGDADVIERVHFVSHHS